MSLNKIPVSIITGFLGAGKTTFIQTLLDRKNKNEYWAILINEFGDISIDSQLLQEKSSKDKIVEISGGCICCSSQQRFSDHLKTILSHRHPQRIIIEPSGLGGLDSIKHAILQETALKLLPSVCILDHASFFNPRIKFNGIFKSQLNGCNVILLSKTDNLSEHSKKTLLKDVKKRYSEKLYYGYTNDNEIYRKLCDLNIDSQTTQSGNTYTFVSNTVPNHKLKQRTFTYGLDYCFSMKAFKIALKSENAIVRAKGFILTDKGWCYFSFVDNAVVFERCLSKPKNSLIVFTEESSDTEDNRMNDQFKKCAI